MSIDDQNSANSKERIEEACYKFSSLGSIHSRPQFGGYRLCCEETTFALVAAGELYLRSNKLLSPYFKQARMEHFVYKKWGTPVSMQYFRVDEQLWQQQDKLLTLASKALDGARHEKQLSEQQRSSRIKDQPNLDLAMERKLWRIGITCAEELKECGAINAYLLLSKLESKKKRKLGVNTLLALEGAIKGCHVAVLPESTKQALLDWWQAHQASNENKC